MKPYIDFNTERRKEETIEADKNNFKLLNNFCIWKNNGKYEKKNKNKNCKK